MTMLRLLNVVVVAEYHNPSILDTNFVVSNHIIPKEWKIVETVTSPGFSILKYDNDIQLVADPDRLNISQACNEQFQEHNSSDIHDIAVRYVDTLPKTPYRKLGLNCTVSITHDDSLEWITKRFLKADSHTAGFYMMPRFIRDTGESKLKLSFTSKKVSGQDNIIIDCNVHYDGPFDHKSLRDKIKGWPGHQKDIKGMIGKLLAGYDG